ncbi:hypothetical protein FRB99_005588 [Tulasnella sp. 403]|nr:hypothetical protein FRB99_005588 [Tulasnella sp. 403]
MKPAVPAAPQANSTQQLPNQNDGNQFTHMPLGVTQLSLPQPWDVETLLQGQAVPAPYAQAQPPIQILTIYMQDFRTDNENPDHLLAELNIPLHKDANEQWWVNADEMVRRLQGTPGRIDGLAKLSIKRGIYRQLFCRLSTTSIEKCHPENLRVTNEHSIEIVIESATIPPPPPPPPPPLPTPPASLPSTGSGKRQPTEEPVEVPTAPPRAKRRKPEDSPITMEVEHTQQPPMATPMANAFASSSTMFNPNQHQHSTFIPNPNPPIHPSQPPVTAPPPPMVPTPARPKVPDTTAVSDAKAADARRNAKNELAKSVIIPWLRGQIEREDGYEAFAKSKGRILTIHEALKGYRFARSMIQKYNNIQTPPDLDGAANRKVTKVNIWQALDRQTSWGSDAETTLALVEKYGPSAPEEHPKIVEMLNGKWGPDEREGSVLFLTHLKRIDAEHKAHRDAAAAAAMAVVHGQPGMA